MCFADVGQNGVDELAHRCAGGMDTRNELNGMVSKTGSGQHGAQ